MQERSIDHSYVIHLASRGGNIDSVLSQMLSKGEIIPQNLNKAKKYLLTILIDYKTHFLYDKVLMKENNKARK